MHVEDIYKDFDRVVAFLDVFTSADFEIPPLRSTGKWDNCKKNMEVGTSVRNLHLAGDKWARQKYIDLRANL